MRTTSYKLTVDKYNIIVNTYFGCIFKAHISKVEQDGTVTPISITSSYTLEQEAVNSAFEVIRSHQFCHTELK